MSKTIITLFFIGISQILLGQNFQEKFAKYCGEKDTLAQRLLLEEWGKSNPNDPELITSYFNYYFIISKQEFIGFDTEPSNTESLQIMDSTNQVKGYFVDKTYFDKELLNKAFETIDKGINKFPNRLDMRFGKIYVYGKNENWEKFTEEIIKTIDFSNKINNQWTWTNNEPLANPEDFFLGNIQAYINQIYETENDSLLKNMREISEQILKYHPTNVESLSNISITYLLTGKYDLGLTPLLKAETINPKDGIVLGNIAQAYKLKGNKEKAIEYYKKAIEYGDEGTKQFAEQQLEILKNE